MHKVEMENRIAKVHSRYLRPVCAPRLINAETREEKRELTETGENSARQGNTNFAVGSSQLRIKLIGKTKRRGR